MIYLSSAIAGGLLILAQSVPLTPGHIERAPFLCHTPEAAMRLGVSVDKQEDVEKVLLTLLRGRECIWLPPGLRREVVYQEVVDTQEKTDVWRVQWGAEDWYIPEDIAPGKGA